MFPWCQLVLLATIPMTLGVSPGVKIRLTAKGIEYGRQVGTAALLQKLKSIKVPDISGTERVAPIGRVQYSLSGMDIVNLGLPESTLGLVPGSGVILSVQKAFISLHGNWKVKYLKFIKNAGSFELKVNELTITTAISIKSDDVGRPAVSTVSCGSTVGALDIKFHGGASWLYNLFTQFIDRGLRDALQQEICHLLSDAISELNVRLQTLNVIAPVDKYAEIQYSMVSPPEVSKSSIDLNLKGEFYGIGQHLEPPFAPVPFSLPPPGDNMLYAGVSAFTANSAGFVYNKAGAISQYITDDMIPPSSPIRLNTRTFGAFIPQIAKRFPGLMMKLFVKTVKDPIITFDPNNATLQATGTVTAYAIQLNTTLSPLFVLNMEASVSAHVYVTGTKLAGDVALNKMGMSLETSYVGDFEVRFLDSIFSMILKVAVIPMVNAHLEKGYPLPSLGKMSLVNTKLQVLKGYVLVGTDLQFIE